MREYEKPFNNIDAFEKFEDYCYVVFGLHFVGDTMTKHTVMDGEAIVKDIRKAAATIKSFTPLIKAAAELSEYIQPDGTLKHDYPQDLMVLLREQGIEQKQWLKRG